MLGALLTIWRNVKLRDNKPWSMIAGGSWAGKAVTSTSAMENAAFWANVRLHGQTVGTLPLFVYRRDGNDGRTIAGEHPLYTLLHDRPNADQTAAELIEGIVVHLLLWGNAYVEKVQSSGRLVALNLLRPDLMAVDRHPETDELRYRYSDPKGIEEFDGDGLMHVRGFGAGGDLGLSILSYARQTLGIAIATDETAARRFANGMRPGGFFNYSKGTLTPEQRAQARQVLVEPFQGSENAGKIGILESNGGFEWMPVSIPAKDEEMLASRGWHVEEICRWFNSPPILIGHASQGQTMWGTGVGQIVLSWYTLALRPLLTRIEQAMRRSLLRPEERATYYVEFLVEGLLRADPAARAEICAKMIQNASMTPNEWRMIENRAPREGGDQLFVNSTLIPLDQAGRKPARVQPAPGEPIPEAQDAA